ncbi:MAG: hypothetical protein ROR55_15340 [Devosia sp.]
MQKTMGAMCALTVLGLLLVGPIYLAVSSETFSAKSVDRCQLDHSCDPTSQMNLARN